MKISKKSTHAKLLEDLIKEFDDYDKKYDKNIINYEVQHYAKKYATVWLVVENRKTKTKYIDQLQCNYWEEKNIWCFDSHGEEVSIDYNCPLEFLEMTPKENNPYYDEDFRNKVKKEAGKS